MHEVPGEGGWIAQIPDSEFTFFTPRGEVSTHPPPSPTPLSQGSWMPRCLLRHSDIEGGGGSWDIPFFGMGNNWEIFRGARGGVILEDMLFLVEGGGGISGTYPFLERLGSIFRTYSGGWCIIIEGQLRGPLRERRTGNWRGEGHSI
jgi:hypothetical protein